MASLKSVLKCWKDFDLPTLHKELDDTANAIGARQDEAEANRKKLIALTKDLKKDWDEELKKRIGPLIRAFQAEVDLLTKRSKAAEASFLTLYKKVLEVPDPSPYLEQTLKYQNQLTKAKDLEFENQKLKETLADYNEEFAEVKNQEVTINKLRQEIKYMEDVIEEKIVERLLVQGKELQAKFDQREQVLQKQQFEAGAKLGEAEEKVRTLQAALEVANSELFASRAKSEEDMAAKIAEIEMIEIDLESAQQRALAAEKFAESLQDELKRALNARADTEQLDVASSEVQHITVQQLESQLADRELELNKMMEEIHFLQGSLARVREQTRHEVSVIERQLEDAMRAVDEYQHKLAEQADYEDIKRELAVLKTVELGESSCINGSETIKSLEQLLLAKNKQLQTESAGLHVTNHELQVRCSELEKKTVEDTRKIKEQADLISQLEQDILNVHSLTSGLRGEGEGEPNPSELDIVNKAVLEVNQASSSAKEQESESMFSIVASQRERFRNRTLELEAQGRHNQQQMLLLRNEVDSLRSDNIKLYEKIKFLQSYPTQSSNLEDDSVKKYSAQYEQRIDPFAAFSKRERQQRYQNLSAAEKVTLNLGRFVLSNKVARTIVFFYTIFLHALVFLVLYKLATTEVCNRDVAADCAKSFAEHMYQFHGNPVKEGALGNRGKT